MTEVHCTVEMIYLTGDHGEIRSVRVTCDRCGHEVTSYGRSDRSVRRCLALLREECPDDEENYYVADDDTAA